MPALHRIDEQQQALFVAELAQAQQVFGRRRGDSALALDALDENGRRRGRNGRARRLQVVERDVSESFHQGLEALLHLLLTGGRDARQRAPVEGVYCCENFEAAFVVTEFPDRLVEALVGLGPGVAEKHLTRCQVTHQALRQSALGLLIVKVRHVDQPPRLLDQRLGDFGMGVTQ